MSDDGHKLSSLPDPSICSRCGSEMDYEGTYESEGLEEELYLCPHCMAEQASPDAEQP